MPLFRKILVPVDFSPHSDKAVELAVDVARKFGARLDLLHAYHLPIGVEYDYSLPPELLPAVREAAIRKLDEAVAKLSGEGLEVGGEVTEGHPSEVILEAARRLEADLIVMGTHGRTGLQHVVLGSVAERTLQHARCSVLTVTAAEPE